VLQEGCVRGETQACVSIAAALQEASNLAGENGRIVTFGSFYTVAEVMRLRGLRGS
jgi:dihydrofolate synthase/folylpolyglutamate synthase